MREVEDLMVAQLISSILVFAKKNWRLFTVFTRGSHWSVRKREIWAYFDYEHCCCCCFYFSGGGGGGGGGGDSSDSSRCWRLLGNWYDGSTVKFTWCWRRDCLASCWPSSETPSDYSTLAITVVCLMLVLSFLSLISFHDLQAPSGAHEVVCYTLISFWLVSSIFRTLIRCIKYIKRPENALWVYGCNFIA